MYTLDHLQCEGFQTTEFTLPLQFPRHLITNTYLEIIPPANCMLNAVLWQPNNMPLQSRRALAVLYLHTNTRNIVDALEVIPLCRHLQCSLLAFDLPGHGKSAIESLSSLVAIEGINSAIEHCLVNYGISEYILWCRGMSTAAGIEYCYQVNKPTSSTIRSSTSTFSKASSASAFSFNPLNLFTGSSDTVEPMPSIRLPLYSDTGHVTYAISDYSRRCSSRIKALVLDSPFTSIKDIVSDAIDQLRSQGYFIPDFIVAIGAKFIRSTLSGKLGIDPYDCCPDMFVNGIDTPCVIMAAEQDDYIATSHAEHYALKWRAPRQMFHFEGSHFSERLPSIVCQTSVFLEEFVLPSCEGSSYASSASTVNSTSANGFFKATSEDRASRFSISKSFSWHEGSKSSSKHVAETLAKTPTAAVVSHSSSSSSSSTTSALATAPTSIDVDSVTSDKQEVVGDTSVTDIDATESLPLDCKGVLYVALTVLLSLVCDFFLVRKFVRSVVVTIC